VKFKVCLFFLLILSNFVTRAEDNSPDAINLLNQVIHHKSGYALQKEQRIDELKKLKTAIQSPGKQLQINNSLYNEYQKYRIDSAIFYCRESLQLAQNMNNNSWLITIKLQLANLYSSLGGYLESADLLKSVTRNSLSKTQKIDYYDAYIQFYEHYTTNSHNKTYKQLIDNYRDTLLTLLPDTSVRYQINLAQRNIRSSNLKAAEVTLLKLLPSQKKNPGDYAMITYLLGSIYETQHQNEQAVNYYALSAAADIKNAIKDNASQQALALIFYRTGDIDHAYRYTRAAIEDAIFCNVKFRTLRISELYSIINIAYLNKESKQKNQLKFSLVLISILFVFLLITVIYVYKQMRRVSRIKEELSTSSQQLARLNAELSDVNTHLSKSNTSLSEANQVKEAYIAQFFDLCSTYINKLENYRKALNKKATEKQLDELFKMLRSTTMVNSEVEDLYRIFDTIFINLYPNFIIEFNALLNQDEQIFLKPGELLNTELRIYALIRLGITDSVKIAAFLRYSLSTIYNYRTSARNKAAVSRDHFEDMVMKIGTISSKNS